MSEQNGQDQAMLKAYSALAQRIWEDEDYGQRAVSDPRSALTENGWDVPEGTEVQLELVEAGEDQAEQLEVDQLLAAWREAIDAGDLKVVVPSEPPSAEAEKLSDEELAGVAGGNPFLAMGGCLCACGCK